MIFLLAFKVVLALLVTSVAFVAIFAGPLGVKDVRAGSSKPVWWPSWVGMVAQAWAALGFLLLLHMLRSYPNWQGVMADLWMMCAGTMLGGGAPPVTGRTRNQNLGRGMFYSKPVKLKEITHPFHLTSQTLL